MSAALEVTRVEEGSVLPGQRRTIGIVASETLEDGNRYTCHCDHCQSHFYYSVSPPINGYTIQSAVDGMYYYLPECPGCNTRLEISDLY